MTYSFRIRFVLGPHHTLNGETELEMVDPVSGSTATLRPAGSEGTLAGTRSFLLTSTGYETEEEAWSQARRWRAAVECACARLYVGADFGDRAAKGGFTTWGLQQLEAQHQARVLNDEHGVMVFEAEPQPKFVSATLAHSVGKPIADFHDSVLAGLEQGVELTEEMRLAFDLYSSSFFQTSADARFVTLMMAVETLLNLKPRSDPAREHVNRLIELTKDAEIDPRERESMLGTLRWLSDESIQQAGSRLAALLGDRRYMDGSEDPVTFFRRSYGVRSQLVHGALPRPERGTVDVRAASLERFVGDLISLPLKLPPRR